MINQDEQIDELHIEGLKIIQNKKLFMFGIDAILLSDFVKIMKNDFVVEFGTGTGIISIILGATSKAKKIIALEIQEKAANMAKRSVDLNNLTDKIEVLNQDLELIDKVLPPQSVNVVVTNPPYIKKSSAKENCKEEIAIARHEIKCSLESVIKAASFVLKPNGRFYMIYKPERLSEIIILGTKYHLEVKKLRFVIPYVGAKATMILVEYVKCAGGGLIVEKDLVVYKEKGVYSQEVMEIYGR